MMPAAVTVAIEVRLVSLASSGLPDRGSTGRCRVRRVLVANRGLRVEIVKRQRRRLRRCVRAGAVRLDWARWTSFRWICALAPATWEAPRT